MICVKVNKPITVTTFPGTWGENYTVYNGNSVITPATTGTYIISGTPAPLTVTAPAGGWPAGVTTTITPASGGSPYTYTYTHGIDPTVWTSEVTKSEYNDNLDKIIKMLSKSMPKWQIREEIEKLKKI